MSKELIIGSQKDFFDFAVQCATALEKIAKAGSVGVVSFHGQQTQLDYKLTLNKTSPNLLKVGIQSRTVILNPDIAKQFSPVFISFLIVWAFVRPDCSSDFEEGNNEADELAFDILYLYQPEIDCDLLLRDFSTNFLTGHSEYRVNNIRSYITGKRNGILPP